jgi:hypothetical protein
MGTDYLPVTGEYPVETTAPDRYESFSHAVLAQHRRVQTNRVDVCTCGSFWKDCEVVILARRWLPPAEA